MSWAYVAGFFDGEGSVLNLIGNQTERSGGGIRRKFCVVLYQNDREVLDRIAAFLASEGIESSVTLHNRPNRLAKGHKGSWQLNVTGGVKNIYRTLDRMFPYLVVKRLAAAICIETLYDLMEQALDGKLDGSGPAARTYRSLREVV